MELYKQLDAGTVKRMSDGACIPCSTENVDYQQFLKWLAAGNLIDPADPPAPPTQDELDAEAAKAYQKLKALVAMTPDQVQTWIAANVTNVAQAQDAIATIAIAISVLARRL